MSRRHSPVILLVKAENVLENHRRGNLIAAHLSYHLFALLPVTILDLFNLKINNHTGLRETPVFIFIMLLGYIMINAWYKCGFPNWNSGICDIRIYHDKRLIQIWFSKLKFRYFCLSGYQDRSWPTLDTNRIFQDKTLAFMFIRISGYIRINVWYK